MRLMSTSVGRVAAVGAIVAAAGTSVAVDIRDNIVPYIGSGLVFHYPMDNLGDEATDPFDPVFSVFGDNNQLVNYGRGGQAWGNLFVEADQNNDFLVEGPKRLSGKLGFALEFTGDDRLRGPTDDNNESPLGGGTPKTVSFWALPSESELSENELIDPGPDFVFGQFPGDPFGEDDVIGDQSSFIDIGDFNGNNQGRGFSVQLDNNDDLEVAFAQGRTNGFGETRPIDLAQRARDGVWTLITVVANDVNDPDYVDRGLPGLSKYDIDIYTDGVLWDSGDGDGDDFLLDTGTNRVLMADLSGGSRMYYEGGIDDVAVWARALGQEEIEVIFELANSPLAYDAGEFDLLRQVHDGELEFARIGNLEWRRATGLSGDRVQGFPPAASVIFDAAGGTGVTSSVAPDGLLVHFPFEQESTGDIFVVNEGLTGAQNDGICLRETGPMVYMFETEGPLGQVMTNIDPTIVVRSGGEPVLNEFGDEVEEPNQNGNSMATLAGPTPILGDEPRTSSLWVRSRADEFDVPFSFGSNAADGGTKWDMTLTNDLPIIDLADPTTEDFQRRDLEPGVPGVQVREGTPVEIGVGLGRMVGEDEQPLTPNVRDNEWHLVTTVLPAGGTTIGDIRVYIDGEFAYQDTTGGSIGNPIRTGPANGWVLLARNANHNAGSNPENRFSGYMDDVALWNVGFSDGLVKGLYDVALGLAYDAADFEALRQVFEAGAGSVQIGNLIWEFASGLGGGNGLSGTDADRELVLDAGTGTGVVSRCAADADANGMLDMFDVIASNAAEGLDFDGDGMSGTAADIMSLITLLETNCGF